MHKPDKYYEVVIDDSNKIIGSWRRLNFRATSIRDARDKAKAYIAAAIIVDELDNKSRIESVRCIGD